jgi:protein-S-isoprenylcysteine O-methyltransferase Ste14
MRQGETIGEDSLRSGMLVALQLMLLALLLWPWTAVSVHLPAALFLLAGAGLGLWALSANRPGNFNLRPAVKPGALFVTTGPYAHVRHPMYSALMLFGLGLVLLYGDWIKALCWAMLVLVLHAKARLEENAMALRFPGYRDYAAMTGRFMPRVLLG